MNEGGSASSGSTNHGVEDVVARCRVKFRELHRVGVLKTPVPFRIIRITRRLCIMTKGSRPFGVT